MRTTITLYAANLNYPPDLQVYTAASGPVASLSALYLYIERSDGFSGVGEVRANITYLSQLPESAVDPAIRDLCLKLPWSASPEEVLSATQLHNITTPHIATAALENALIEGMAMRDGISVAKWLGGKFEKAVETNQCLFWSPDERFDRLTDRFIREGFRHLKVRIAVGTFAHDIERLTRLRERIGSNVSIAVDANGAWSSDEAIKNLKELEKLNLCYVEQPTMIGDWPAFRRAASSTCIPLMVDEGLSSDNDVDELCRIGNFALAHLKIVKLGGPTAVVSAMKRFRDAGISVMIGQMNEGALATAMTAHTAMALQPRYAELYGCYGLLDDVTTGVSYINGDIIVPSGPGLGTRFNPTRCSKLWAEQVC